MPPRKAKKNTSISKPSLEDESKKRALAPPDSDVYDMEDDSPATARRRTDLGNTIKSLLTNMESDELHCRQEGVSFVLRIHEHSMVLASLRDDSALSNEPSHLAGTLRSIMSETGEESQKVKKAIDHLEAQESIIRAAGGTLTAMLKTNRNLASVVSDLVAARSRIGLSLGDTAPFASTPHLPTPHLGGPFRLASGSLPQNVASTLPKASVQPTQGQPDYGGVMMIRRRFAAQVSQLEVSNSYHYPSDVIGQEVGWADPQVEMSRELKTKVAMLTGQHPVLNRLLDEADLMASPIGWSREGAPTRQDLPTDQTLAWRKEAVDGYHAYAAGQEHGAPLTEVPVPKGAWASRSTRQGGRATTTASSRAPTQAMDPPSLLPLVMDQHDMKTMQHLIDHIVKASRLTVPFLASEPLLQTGQFSDDASEWTRASYNLYSDSHTGIVDGLWNKGACEARNNARRSQQSRADGLIPYISTFYEAEENRKVLDSARRTAVAMTSLAAGTLDKAWAARGAKGEMTAAEMVDSMEATIKQLGMMSQFLYRTIGNHDFTAMSERLVRRALQLPMSNEQAQQATQAIKSTVDSNLSKLAGHGVIPGTSLPLTTTTTYLDKLKRNLAMPTARARRGSGQPGYGAKHNPSPIPTGGRGGYNASASFRGRGRGGRGGARGGASAAATNTSNTQSYSALKGFSGDFQGGNQPLGPLGGSSDTASLAEGGGGGKAGQTRDGSVVGLVCGAGLDRSFERVQREEWLGHQGQGGGYEETRLGRRLPMESRNTTLERPFVREEGLLPCKRGATGSRLADRDTVVAGRDSGGSRRRGVGLGFKPQGDSKAGLFSSGVQADSKYAQSVPRGSPPSPTLSTSLDSDIAPIGTTMEGGVGDEGGGSAEGLLPGSVEQQVEEVDWVLLARRGRNDERIQMDEAEHGGLTIALVFSKVNRAIGGRRRRSGSILSRLSRRHLFLRATGRHRTSDGLGPPERRRVPPHKGLRKRWRGWRRVGLDRLDSDSVEGRSLGSKGLLQEEGGDEPGVDRSNDQEGNRPNESGVFPWQGSTHQHSSAKATVGETTAEGDDAVSDEGRGVLRDDGRSQEGHGLLDGDDDATGQDVPQAVSPAEHSRTDGFLGLRVRGTVEEERRWRMVKRTRPAGRQSDTGSGGGRGVVEGARDDVSRDSLGSGPDPYHGEGTDGMPGGPQTVGQPMATQPSEVRNGQHGNQDGHQQAGFQVTGDGERDEGVHLSHGEMEHLRHGDVHPGGGERSLGHSIQVPGDDPQGRSWTGLGGRGGAQALLDEGSRDGSGPGAARRVLLDSQRGGQEDRRERLDDPIPLRTGEERRYVQAMDPGRPAEGGGVVGSTSGDDVTSGSQAERGAPPVEEPRRQKDGHSDSPSVETYGVVDEPSTDGAGLSNGGPGAGEHGHGDGQRELLGSLWDGRAWGSPLLVAGRPFGVCIQDLKNIVVPVDVNTTLTSYNRALVNLLVAIEEVTGSPWESCDWPVPGEVLVNALFRVQLRHVEGLPGGDDGRGQAAGARKALLAAAAYQRLRVTVLQTRPSLDAGTWRLLLKKWKKQVDEVEVHHTVPVLWKQLEGLIKDLTRGAAIGVGRMVWRWSQGLPLLMTDLTMMRNVMILLIGFFGMGRASCISRAVLAVGRLRGQAALANVLKTRRAMAKIFDVRDLVRGLSLGRKMPGNQELEKLGRGVMMESDVGCPEELFLVTKSKTGWRRIHLATGLDVTVSPVRWTWMWMVLRQVVWNGDEDDGSIPVTLVTGTSKSHARKSVKAATVGALNKRALMNIEQDESDRPFSGHSLRAGGATQAVLNGVPLPIVCKYGGWSEVSTVVKAYLQHVTVDFTAGLQRAQGQVSDTVNLQDGEELVRRVQNMNMPETDTVPVVDPARWEQELQEYDPQDDEVGLTQLVPDDEDDEPDSEEEEEERDTADRALEALESELVEERVDGETGLLMSTAEFAASWDEQTQRRFSVPDGAKRTRKKSYADMF